jgi:outer membrane lipoprotein-sorting protein
MRTLLVALFVLLLAAPAGAQQLTPDDVAAVARVEAYFNQIKTLKARFTQVGARGEIAEGWFYLSRPNRLRFEYDPPVPVMVVADGFRLIYYDKQLDQENAWPVAGTPLGPILADTVALQKMVRRVEREPGSLRITLVDPGRADEGSITLVFTDQPLELRQWTVIDAAGLSTILSLTNAEINTRVDADLFFLPDRPAERP